jgi:hypothetical protein
MMNKPVLLYYFFLFSLKAYTQDLIAGKSDPGNFPLVTQNGASPICTDPDDFWLVQKVSTLLQTDILKVSGMKSGIVHSLRSSGKTLILIGSLEKSGMIRRLVEEKKLKVDGIQGKWEAYQISLVNHPAPGVDLALVIAGSDKRGVAYGVFELSRQMGVSPWYWWADVPVKLHKEVYIQKTAFLSDSPSVKYRGIFINDEAPAFAGWANEKFGGLNHGVYENVFELLLRLKANYLWPAMWGNAFNDDDSLNPVLADQYGIVMGTSHHEPMLRAQQEWKRYGSGKWDYDSNQTVLRDFWRKGIQHMGTHESIVSIGMRGDGDKPMSQGTAIGLLEKIVKDQRAIIEEVTGKPAHETPQLWALYKEVQDYYDAGMRVPDDVTLLLCDDNWGNIRRLPRLTDPPRGGGYGIYYHFDYVGDPRNYKWLNTNQIERTWEQMHLAYQYGVNKIWIVNVGDLKPMELPISFFLDYAWNPGRLNEGDLPNYYTHWAAQQFGEEHAKEIGSILQKYTQYNARKKPELLSPDTYSLKNYHEARRIMEAYRSLLAEAEKLGQELPLSEQDAYFELVLHPVKACANLNELYVTVAENRSYASVHRILANRFADRAKQLYLKDSMISLQYNKEIAGGKWNHMMDQTHIGYTYWQQPPVNKMPDLIYIPERPPESPGPLSIAPARDSKDMISKNAVGNLFDEENGLVSIDAEHFTKAIDGNHIRWKVIPGLGRTGSGVTSFPVTAAKQIPGISSPDLEYQIYSYDSGEVKIDAYFSPTLNFQHDEGLQYGISIDDEKPQILSINQEDSIKAIWEGWVADNIIIKTTLHRISSAGRHIVKYWVVSPAVILQKLVLDFGGLKQSYLGPPETRVRTNN